MNIFICCKRILLSVHLKYRKFNVCVCIYTHKNLNSPSSLIKNPVGPIITLIRSTIIPSLYHRCSERVKYKNKATKKNERRKRHEKRRKKTDAKTLTTFVIQMNRSKDSLDEPRGFCTRSRHSKISIAAATTAAAAALAECVTVHLLP